LKIELQVNGEAVALEGEPLARLLDVVREQLGLTGTKEGCGEGECGACTVMMDDLPVLSCLTPLVQCAGKRIDTIEGVAEGEAKAFIESFVATGGVQCGACTPGVILSAWALLERNDDPSRQEVEEALAGNLCRCTGYEGIHRAFAARKAAQGEG
jgi:aerobic-type carbon monoxide dehydrogenase small subunit (CoxS/CutS family)